MFPAWESHLASGTAGAKREEKLEEARRRIWRRAQHLA
jgi:hypothetical protein